MATLLAFPILGLLVVTQSAVVSRITLLHGTADVVMLAVIAWALHKRVQTAWQWGIIGGLMVSYVSALPFGVPLIGYLIVLVLAQVLRKRVWQAPILAMLFTVFIGTLVTHAVTLLALQISGTSVPVFESLNLITVPSLILNLLLAIPIFAILSDLGNLLYPEPLEM